MATSRKPTVLGVPAPVLPQPTVPGKRGSTPAPTITPVATPVPITARSAPISSELEAPTSIDDEPAEPESTTVDPKMPIVSATLAGPVPLGKGLPDTSASRWEASTVAEKSTARNLKVTPEEIAPAIAGGSAPVISVDAVPEGNRFDDSARVLNDIDDSRVGGPTAVDDNALANMPTAIGAPSHSPTRPLGIDSPDGRLEVIGGNDRGREFALAGRETSLGRGADNDIILTDIAVSRRHIIVFHDGHRYGLRDLSSGNGTLVNGVRISGDVFIHDGDQLELGNTLVRFDLPGQVHAPARPSLLTPGGGAPVGPPLPGVGPQTPGMLGGSLPLLAQQPPPAVFAPVGSSVVPPPQPPAADSLTPLSQPVFLGPQNPSARAMDLFKGQRKLVLYLAGSFVGFTLLVVAAVKLSSAPERTSSVVSTEAQSSPALSALLADVEKSDAAPAVTPPPPAPRTPPVAADRPEPPPPVALPPVAAKPVPPRPAPRRAPVRVVKKVGRTPVKKVVKEDAPSVAAEKAAVAFYKNKDFARASDTLLAAAGKEAGATADRLEATAKDYGSVGAYLGKGDASATANPGAAMTAYKQAFQLDARSGRGAHAAYLKAQMARVAPKAAMALYGAGKLELAREACEAASADPGCVKLRGLLEGKARDFFNQASALGKSKPEDAKALWRRVLKIVPAESPWYAKSYAALNKAARGKDVDEDE